MLFPPPTRSNAVDDKGFLAIPLRQWLFTLQNLLPLVEVDTSSGDQSFALPPAGLNSATGQSNQNQEIVYVKISADANTATITGAETGAMLLTKQWDSARFKSDGTNWLNSGVGSSAGPGSASFALLTSGENDSATMVVGTGASLSAVDDGVIDATEINGIKITGTPSLGKIPIGQGGDTAVFADPLVQGLFPPDTNADTGNGGAPINPVLMGARNTADAKLKDVACDADGNIGVNVQSSTLATGAATAANQTTEIAGLAAILAALGATLDVDVTASVLPTNAAQETGGNLAAIKADTDTLAGAVSGGKINVTGLVSTKTALTPSSPSAATVGTSSGSAVAADADRTGLVLINTSNAIISLGLGAAAVLNSGITLNPNGGTFVMDEFTFTTAQVFAIAAAASSNLAIQEFA
jgi:hypothetical protein